MNKYTPIIPVYTNLPIVIATSTTVSAEAYLGDKVLVGLVVPSTFDGTTITITNSDVSGGTFVAVQADNSASTAYTITTTASRYVPINEVVSKGLKFIKLTCGSAQTTTDTVFQLVTRPMQ